MDVLLFPLQLTYCLEAEPMLSFDLDVVASTRKTFSFYDLPDILVRAAQGLILDPALAFS